MTSLFDPGDSFPKPRTTNAVQVAGSLTRRADYFHLHYQYDQACELYLEAIKVNPRHTKAYYQLGLVKQKQQEFQEAIRYYRLSLSCNPNHPQAATNLTFLLMQTCHWDLLPHAYQHLKQISQKPQDDYLLPPLHPYISFSLDHDQNYQTKQVQSWSQAQDRVAKPYKDQLAKVPPPLPHPQLRLGYMSSQFNQSPLGESLLQLINLHMQNGLEVHCFSHGSFDGSNLLKRLSSIAASFTDVHYALPDTFASSIKKKGIDILIDLDGLLPSSKLDVLALRPAPVQVSWLGIPSTLGGSCADYLITDQYSLTNQNTKYLLESAVILPHSCLPPFPQFPPTAHRYKRADFKLKANSFIFANFSPSKLITQDVFTIWLNIIKKIPNSMLWLLSDNPVAETNMHQHAKINGVDPSRILFTSKLPLIAHLERYRLVNLLLDTHPLSDFSQVIPALYTGTPVITLEGRSLSSRTVASALKTAKLHELITPNNESYLNTAIRLATDHTTYQTLKTKVQNLDPALPLFNAPLFAQSLESAYHQIWSRHQKSLPPHEIKLH